MNPFEMNYPGTLNAGPVFKSFSDRLMSARFCAGSVLEAGRFDFDAFLRPVSPVLASMVEVTDVCAASDLGTLSCRIDVTTSDGGSVHGEIRDGGRDLAIDWDNIDAWCLDLWHAGGRSPENFQRVRAALVALPRSGFEDLRASLVHAGPGV